MGRVPLLKLGAIYKSHFHNEVQMKWIAQERRTIENEINIEVKRATKHRVGLVLQLRATQYFTRQGVALQGHVEYEGNIMKVMLTLRHEDEIARSWLREKWFTSPQIVNEVNEEMYFVLGI